MQAKLAETFGQPSTVAAANQNNYNYVFRVHGVAEAPELVVSIADWQNKLRLGSNYGWALDARTQAHQNTPEPPSASFQPTTQAPFIRLARSADQPVTALSKQKKPVSVVRH